MNYDSQLGSFFLLVLISSLLLILTPEGGVKKIARMLSSILIFFSFLPIGNRFLSLSTDFAYQDYLEHAEITLEEAETNYKNEILHMTREEISSRIQTKAAEWGMDVEVTVELCIDEGNRILPESIQILHHVFVEEDTLMKLRQWIFTDFNVKPARQKHIFK